MCVCARAYRDHFVRISRHGFMQLTFLLCLWIHDADPNLVILMHMSNSQASAIISMLELFIMNARIIRKATHYSYSPEEN